MEFKARKSLQPVYTVIGMDHTLDVEMRANGFIWAQVGEGNSRLRLTWDENMNLVEYFGDYQELGPVLTLHDLSMERVECAFALYSESLKGVVKGGVLDADSVKIAENTVSDYFVEMGKYGLSNTLLGADNDCFNQIAAAFKYRYLNQIFDESSVTLKDDK